MPESFFQFKHFLINQENCAMKVCTDACFFGAYVNAFDAKNILDIGTGTGLLSLMLAQRTIANITSIEIDKQAYSQAKNNFENSQWNNRLNAVYGSIQEFSKNSNSKFDLIISNPPFFQSSLKSKKLNHNVALHGSELSFSDLIISVNNLLNPQGFFWVMLPLYESELLIEIANGYGLYKKSECNLFATENGRLIRKITCFGYAKNEHCTIENYNIKNENDAYSDSFKEILKDFYLAF